ncbi:MAG TPA: RidA family protein [Mycobacteriales bacterium]|nr:RidA family protein [Mycobacteriales bacterium]
MDGDRLTAAPLDPPADLPTPTIEAVRRDGDTLIASGQIATRDGVLLATGRVGAEVDLETARRCAWQCARNVLEAVRADAGDLENVEAVKLTIFVASTPDFTDQPLVGHAASALVLDVLGDRGRHARAAIGVAALPLNTPVEVEGTFRLRQA